MGIYMLARRPLYIEASHKSATLYIFSGHFPYGIISRNPHCVRSKENVFAYNYTFVIFLLLSIIFLVVQLHALADLFKAGSLLVLACHLPWLCWTHKQS